MPDGSRDFIVDRSLPLELGMDVLHGVDFDKGCYVGQEVTARSRHRGTLRKALYQVRSDEESLPAPDTPILAGNKEIGTLRSSVEAHSAVLLAQIVVENMIVRIVEKIFLIVDSQFSFYRMICCRSQW